MVGIKKKLGESLVFAGLSVTRKVLNIRGNNINVALVAVRSSIEGASSKLMFSVH